MLSASPRIDVTVMLPASVRRRANRSMAGDLYPEQQLCQVHDPYPLPVRCDVGSAEVSDRWANVRQARRVLIPARWPWLLAALGQNGPERFESVLSWAIYTAVPIAATRQELHVRVLIGRRVC